MRLRKLIPLIAAAATLAACSADAITGPAKNPKTATPAPHHDTVDGVGSLGGGGRS
jgi:outer membrane biogenesis lipoprotein LolB